MKLTHVLTSTLIGAALCSPSYAWENPATRLMTYAEKGRAWEQPDAKLLATIVCVKWNAGEEGAASDYSAFDASYDAYREVVHDAGIGIWIEPSDWDFEFFARSKFRSGWRMVNQQWLDGMPTDEADQKRMLNAAESVLGKPCRWAFPTALDRPEWGEYTRKKTSYE